MKKILLLLLLPIITLAQKEVIVHINTDSYPTETRWVLYADSLYGSILEEVSYGYYTQSNTSYSDTFYIPDSLTNVTFIIWDSYGDGMSGSYYVDICGDTVVSNTAPSFSYGWYHNIMVPQCMANPPPGVPAKVIINLDQYQSETSWDIKDTNGTIYASGGGYYSQPDYATVIEPVIIPKGNLVFTIYDTYGDGLNGALWQGQDGSYYVVQCNDTLIYGTNPAFGYNVSHTFLSDSCPPILGCTDDDYVEYNPFADVDDGSCSVLKIYGCVDSTMFNYNPSANTMDLIDTCTFKLVLHDLMGNGWVGSHLKLIHSDTTYQFVHTGAFDDIYYIGLAAPDPITFRFHISSQASLTTIECGFTFINPEGDTLISIQPPFIQPLLPYNLITNCGNTCIERVFGCPDILACNYTSGVNTPIPCTYPVTYYNCNNECINDIDNDGVCDELEVIGCQDPSMFNYNILATDSGMCEPFIYGCTDPLMYNYNPIANTDNGNCEPYVFGCIDSLMFNFNPLANVDNNSCIPFIYGCTDPSMLNYNASANTEDFSCIPFIYGCMDSTAFNYDSTANTDNGSCVVVVEGCMDPSAYNYSDLANVNDSSSCLYIAGCVTGPGIPYWLNDPCYAWTIEVDEYCCENEWDTICQLTYDHCANGWTGELPPARTIKNDIIIYPNPTSGIIMFNNKVNVRVYNTQGKQIINKDGISQIDLSKYSNGIYNISIIFMDIKTNHRIIKQ